MKLGTLFLFFFLATLTSKANTSERVNFQNYQFILTVLENNVSDTISDDAVVTVKFQRGKAILFTVFTGFLGGHRIYLGTHQRTPIIYSVTLGGLGILPLIDLVQIIFTKDLSKFEYRPQIIMWGK